MNSVTMTPDSLVGLLRATLPGTTRVEACRSLDRACIDLRIWTSDTTFHLDAWEPGESTYALIARLQSKLTKTGCKAAQCAYPSCKCHVPLPAAIGGSYSEIPNNSVPGEKFRAENQEVGGVCMPIDLQLGHTPSRGGST